MPDMAEQNSTPDQTPAPEGQVTFTLAEVQALIRATAEQAASDAVAKAEAARPVRTRSGGGSKGTSGAYGPEYPELNDLHRATENAYNILKDLREKYHEATQTDPNLHKEPKVRAALVACNEARYREHRAAHDVGMLGGPTGKISCPPAIKNLIFAEDRDLAIAAKAEKAAQAQAEAAKAEAAKAEQEKAEQAKAKK
jgi:hypothetical protein